MSPNRSSCEIVSGAAAALLTINFIFEQEFPDVVVPCVIESETGYVFVEASCDHQMRTPVELGLSSENLIIIEDIAHSRSILDRLNFVDWKGSFANYDKSVFTRIDVEILRIEKVTGNPGVPLD
jgi:hypothetical protein